MWPTASIWWPLKYSLVILPPFAMLIDHWVTPLRCTGVTEGSNNQPRVALLAYFDQYTGYVTKRQYLMTPRVLLSNLTTICNAYWPLNSTLMIYRGHRRVQKSPAWGTFTILLLNFYKYTDMTNKQYLMTFRILLRNLNTIYSAYWSLDSTLVMYRGHRRVQKSPAWGNFSIFWSIYWTYDQQTIFDDL